MRPYLLWKVNRKPHPSFWMILSYLFKVVTIIQRHITWKWYKIQLYLQWLTNRKSYMIYRTVPFSVTLNNPYPQFQGHAILWCWISQKQCYTQTQFQWNTNIHNLPNSVISNDLEWLSKIFNDMKLRAVSLRQLSFLFILHCVSKKDSCDQYKNLFW